MLLFNPRRLRWCVLVAAIVGLPFYVPALIDLWVIYDYQPQVDFEPNTWASADVLDAHNSTCQQMVRHLILKVLPGKTREEIERQLGRSPTHEDERRYSRKDLEFREKDEHGEWQPFKRTGHGYCYDEFDWDLIYYIGREHIFIFDHKGQEMSSDSEALLIRLDADGVFSSWYIVGSERWPKIVGEEAMKTYRARR